MATYLSQQLIHHRFDITAIGEAFCCDECREEVMAKGGKEITA